MAASEFINYYQVLEIPNNAPDADIREAVSKERRKWRKRQNAPSPDRRAQAESRMRQIGEAEQTLLDAGRRAAYDRQLAAEASRPQSADPSLGTTGADGWVERANELLQMSNPRAAHFAAQEACRLDPTMARAWYVRGQSSSMMQNLDEADFELTESLRMDPRNVGTCIDLADVKISNGNPSGAFQVLESARQMEPENIEVRIAMVYCYLAADTPRLALDLIEPLVEENPGNEYFNYCLAVVLENVAEQFCTTLTTGEFMVTNPAQAQAALTCVNRALTLTFDDAEWRQQLIGTRDLVQQSIQKVYIGPAVWQGWAFGLVFSLVMIFAYGIGILLLAGLGAWFYYAHWIPQWKISERICRNSSGRVKSWGLSGGTS